MPLLAAPPAPSRYAPYPTPEAPADAWERLPEAERATLLKGLLALGTLDSVAFDAAGELVHLVATAPSGRRYEGTLHLADLALPALA
jgi:hypothetical protein